MQRASGSSDGEGGATSVPADPDHHGAAPSGIGGVAYAWRGAFANTEVAALHAEGFGPPVRDHDWAGRLERHSLGWVTARCDGRLVGFVNVPWDGDRHAFLLDTLVALDHRRSGIGARMVATCAVEAHAAGCAWLHVDFEAPLARFYLEACGFGTTSAGVLALPTA